MYAMDAASSETVWLEKCSTLIGGGTPVWALILRPRGFVCHSIPDLHRECRILPFLLKPIFPELLSSSF